MFDLEQASAKLFGPYDNGAGRRRHTIQEVLNGKPKQGSEGKTFEPKSVLAGLQKIVTAARMPEEEREAGGTWGWEKMLQFRAAARTAVEESEMSEGIIARFALSEVDPRSLEFPISEEAIQYARIVTTAREVAHRFHRYSMMDD